MVITRIKLKRIIIQTTNVQTECHTGIANIKSRHMFRCILVVFGYKYPCTSDILPQTLNNNNRENKNWSRRYKQFTLNLIKIQNIQIIVLLFFIKQKSQLL